MMDFVESLFTSNLPNNMTSTELQEYNYHQQIQSQRPPIPNYTNVSGTTNFGTQINKIEAPTTPQCLSVENYHHYNNPTGYDVISPVLRHSNRDILPPYPGSYPTDLDIQQAYPFNPWDQNNDIPLSFQDIFLGMNGSSNESPTTSASSTPKVHAHQIHNWGNQNTNRQNNVVSYSGLEVTSLQNPEAILYSVNSAAHQNLEEIQPVGWSNMSYKEQIIHPQITDDTKTKPTRTRPKNKPRKKTNVIQNRSNQNNIAFSRTTNQSVKHSAVAPITSATPHDTNLALQIKKKEDMSNQSFDNTLSLQTGGCKQSLISTNSNPSIENGNKQNRGNEVQPKSKITANAGKKGKLCSIPNCVRRAQSLSRCKAHGGGARCQYSGPGGCTRSSQGGGLCRGHGGGKRCQFPGCVRGQQRKGRCYIHGGIRKCQFTDCEKKDRGNGFCIAHGGGKRCKASECSRAVRRGQYCQIHET